MIIKIIFFIIIKENETLIKYSKKQKLLIRINLVRFKFKYELFNEYFKYSS